MQKTWRHLLIDGLWDRFSRYARKGTASQRSWIVQELTHVLSCKECFNDGR